MAHMEDILGRSAEAGTEPRLESVHLLQAIDSRDEWLAGELGQDTRELLLVLSFEEALGYVCTVIVDGGRDIDDCLGALGILETAPQRPPGSGRW